MGNSIIRKCNIVFLIVAASFFFVAVSCAGQQNSNETAAENSIVEVAEDIEDSGEPEIVAEEGQEAHPHCIIVSDVHLSALNGRYQHATEHFERFLDRIQTDASPDFLFVVGDIIDNAIMTEDGVRGGDYAHWKDEIDTLRTIGLC